VTVWRHKTRGGLIEARGVTRKEEKIFESKSYVGRGEKAPRSFKGAETEIQGKGGEKRALRPGFPKKGAQGRRKGYAIRKVDSSERGGARDQRGSGQETEILEKKKRFEKKGLLYLPNVKKRGWGLRKEAKEKVWETADRERRGKTTQFVR